MIIGYKACKPRKALNVIQNVFLTRPSVAYERIVSEGRAHSDPRQLSALSEFDRLWSGILEHHAEGEEAQPELEEKQTFWSSLFARKPEEKSKRSPVRGVFLYGDGGCGKTFLMDLVYEQMPVKEKRRIHFHGFMLEVHERLHKQRQATGEVDVAKVAQTIVDEGARLFCFDEMNPTDIGDAVILKMLFQGLIDNGAILVTTGKLPPDEVYKNGYRRDLFVPCIELMKQVCVVHNMGSDLNYRVSFRTEADNYLFPVTETTDAEIDKKIAVLSNGNPLGSAEIMVQNRKVVISKCSLEHKVADFDFLDLADQNVGAAYFYALASNFETVVIRNIPILQAENRHWGKRFLTLLDVLYDHKVKTICSAEAAPLEVIEKNLLRQSIDQEYRLEDITTRLSDMSSLVYQECSYRKPIPKAA